MPRGINTQDEGRIQGRNVVNANSSNIVDPGIVTDGLVLHLDAGNYNSYPISGTTWYDLSGNRNNGTLTNGPTYSRDVGGAIDFDGTDDYILLPTNATLTFTTGDFAFDCWFLTDATSNSESMFGVQSGQTLQMSNSGSRFFYYNSLLATGFTLKDPISTGIWYNTVITRTNETINGYFDAVSQFTITSNTVTHDFSGAGIGRRTISPAGFNWNGKIALVRIYRRGLSPTEVAQNFNANRARFNI